MPDMSVLIASGGRRPYLVRWFREALRRNDVNGHVLVADMDRFSPAAAVADEFVEAPAVTDPGYASWLAATLGVEAVTLAVSINDFELSCWSRLGDGAEFAPLVRLHAARQRAIEDKLETARLLHSAGVESPVTLLASDALALGMGELQTRLGADEFVVKGRFGSGSRGLGFATTDTLRDTVARARRAVTHRDGRSQRDDALADALIVVQPRIRGAEHGVDVVADLRGEFRTVLARRKLAMRGGETDRAESVDPSQFASIGQGVTRALAHRGLVDLDVMLTDAGDLSVIDVNPRFGGGYPLSHVAGADIPAAMIAWAANREADARWLQATPGTIAAKAVEVLAVATPASATTDARGDHGYGRSTPL